MSYYAFQVAYGVMIFGITLMIALLYGLLGKFHPSLLVLRLEETAAGAAIGVAVTMLVLPARDRDVFAKAARAFVDALAQAVEQARQAPPEAARAAARDMQRKAQAFRAAIGPLKRGWGPLAPLRYRRAVRAAMRCAYLTRELIQPNRDIGDRQVEAIRAELEAMRSGLEQGRRPSTSADSGTPAVSHEHHDLTVPFGAPAELGIGSGRAGRCGTAPAGTPDPRVADGVAHYPRGLAAGTTRGSATTGSA